jgi:predicted dehydrogenase
MLSMWHVHANGYAQFVNEQSDTKVAAIWDNDAARGKAAAEKFAAVYEPDLDKFLTLVDAVIVDAPTTEHKPLVIKAARAKKHIFTEKALAPTVAECEEIAGIIRENGVQFGISFPGLISGEIRYAKAAIDEGKLGKVTYLRIREAHGGSSQGWLPDYWYDATKTGGGAMMDLGCHPNYQASYLLGKPARIASIFNTVCCPKTMEDNAVSVVEFENQAIAVLETGFVSPYSPSSIEILGTEGSILIEKGEKLRIYSKPSGVNGWVIPDDIPAPLPVAMRQFFDGVLYGKEIEFGLDKAIALTELLENEYKADAQQKVVKL